eukprot:TRINITY_DN1672_c0_g2_i1.p1 TRINITY_DN1672_c0_g2~~TRINITY_DN1672_c0_g2_i1.p1  ORF type:complete len:233 (+),score=71.64 TRINITY_DN1672_c0_g2_i1:221-919(+)
MVSQALRQVLLRVQQAADRANRSASNVRVVAVSKTKPVELLKEAFDAGQRHFGENYVQELVEKAAMMPPDVQWHFIGHLQTNKAKSLIKVPNLFMVETVDSKKLASQLDKVISSVGRPPLKVLVQVNTSGEESKFGIQPEECVAMAQHVKEECPNLVFAGLMTIGMLDYSSRPENFQMLQECREDVCKSLGLNRDEVELSMGMSGDFEQAIEMGSTNIRVGSTIFGAREYKK